EAWRVDYNSVRPHTARWPVVRRTSLPRSLSRLALIRAVNPCANALRPLNVRAATPNAYSLGGIQATSGKRNGHIDEPGVHCTVASYAAFLDSDASSSATRSDFPELRRHTGCHRGRHSQRPVNPHEVVCEV